MYRTYRILTNILLSLTVLILISTVTIVLLCRTNNSMDRLSFFGYKPFTISSGSMEPSFLKGSFLVTNKVSQDQIRVGDVLAYKASDNMLVFHRVVGINDDGYTMKGDRLDYADGMRVPYERVIGKMMFHTNFFAIVSKIAGLLLGNILLPMLIIIFSSGIVIFGIKYLTKLRLFTYKN